MADGDLVVRISARTMPGAKSETFVFNMFRVKDGKLAEHWDAMSGGMMMPGPAPGGPNESGGPGATPRQR